MTRMPRVMPKPDDSSILRRPLASSSKAAVAAKLKELVGTRQGKPQAADTSDDEENWSPPPKRNPPRGLARHRPSLVQLSRTIDIFARPPRLRIDAWS